MQEQDELQTEGQDTVRSRESAEAISETERPWSNLVATLRVPHFFPLWSSNLIQFCATFAQMVTLQWLVTSLTDSRTMLGLVGFLHGGTVFLASPMAGVALDRFSKRHILMAGRVGLAGVILVVTSLVALERITIWHLLLWAIAAGLLMSLIQPATQTFVFDVVGRGRVQSALGLNAAATSVGQTAGPFIGGVLLGSLGFVGAYLASATGLGVAAAMLLLVPVLGRSIAAPGGANWWADLRESLEYVISHRPVLLALIACSMAIFNGALIAMRPIFARHVLHVGSVGYGSMAAAAGFGGMFAALVVASLPKARRPGLMIAGSMLGYATLLLLYSFAFSFEYILLIEFGIGIFGQLWTVSTFSGLQMAVPEEMRGRVISLVFMLVMLAPTSQLFVGLLADTVGDQLALGIFGVIPMIVLTGLLVLGHKSLSEL
jgi:MFS family permease